MKLFASLTVSLLVLAALAFAQQPRASFARAIFADKTQDAGLEFTHINGATGELLLPEVIGSGGAVFDYDQALPGAHMVRPRQAAFIVTIAV